MIHYARFFCNIGMPIFLRITFLGWAFPLFMINPTIAQNTISIGSISNANQNSLLDISSTNQGILLPRLSTTQMLAIKDPADGLWVLNTDKDNFYVFEKSSGWVEQAPSPAGLVTLWYGARSNFDASGLGKGNLKGWALCNGKNNTIDLSGFFIAGYDQSHPDFGDLGASIKGQNNFILEKDNLPAHKHIINDPGHKHDLTITSGLNHSHTASIKLNQTSGSYAKADDGTKRVYSSPGLNKQISTTKNELQGALLTNSAGLTLESTGLGESVDNRPNYFTIFYIQKLGDFY
jgi:hypothetical protein